MKHKTADEIKKDLLAYIKRVIARSPVVVPEAFAKVISGHDQFIRNVTYITEKGYYVGTKKKPLEGEIGIFDGRRIVINLPATS